MNVSFALVIQAAPARFPRPNAFVSATAILTIALGLCVGGISLRQRDVAMPMAVAGILLGFGCAFWVSSGARFRRLLPLAIANLIVAIWPLYRWLAYRDARTLTIAGEIAGFVDAMMVLFVAVEFARRRGWAVDPMKSPVRRWVVTGSMFASYLLDRLVWPTGPMHTGVFIAWLGVSVWGTFWPIRRTSQPNQSVTA